MIVDVDYRQELGRRARRFYEDNWRLTDVAKKYVRLIQGDFPGRVVN